MAGREPAAATPATAWSPHLGGCVGACGLGIRQGATLVRTFAGLLLLFLIVSLHLVHHTHSLKALLQLQLWAVALLGILALPVSIVSAFVSEPRPGACEWPQALVSTALISSFPDGSNWLIHPPTVGWPRSCSVPLLQSMCLPLYIMFLLKAMLDGMLEQQPQSAALAAPPPAPPAAVPAVARHGRRRSQR
ncbi:hypothetical protein ABPG75_001954 [Micractinium tetrahymenae]